MSKPPIFGSPRFFRMLWLIIRERFNTWDIRHGE